jgi:hypothetical protein
MEARYIISVTAESFRQHQGVRFYLFHVEGLADDLYRRLIPPGMNWLDPSLQSMADDTFDAQEVEALRRWFAGQPGLTVSAEAAEPIGPGDKRSLGGFGAGPVGLSGGWLCFEELAGWPLPCKVHGNYDLRHAESGPYVDNPNLSMMRVYEDEDGNRVVKQPPF